MKDWCSPISNTTTPAPGKRLTGELRCGLMSDLRRRLARDLRCGCEQPPARGWAADRPSARSATNRQQASGRPLTPMCGWTTSGAGVDAWMVGRWRLTTVARSFGVTYGGRRLPAREWPSGDASCWEGIRFRSRWCWWVPVGRDRECDCVNWPIWLGPAVWDWGD
jgi:hypothetical protein